MVEEILIVAGEASAELHAARALEELRRIRPELRAFGVGGPRLRAAGLEAFHTEDLDALVAWARAEVRPSSDVLLVKGSRGMKLERLVEALR